MWFSSDVGYGGLRARKGQVRYDKKSERSKEAGAAGDGDTVG